MNPNAPNSTRAATMDELIANTLPHFITPIPTKETLRAWFDAAKIPRFKSNPLAKRGGGPVFYSVAAVEKFLRSRIGAPMRSINRPTDSGVEYVDTPKEVLMGALAFLSASQKKRLINAKLLKASKTGWNAADNVIKNFPQENTHDAPFSLTQRADAPPWSGK